MEIIERDKCSGCEMCYNICSKNAIMMEKDEEGFRYPSVDSFKCIKCGLCQKKCPINNRDSIKITTHNIKTYAVTIKEHAKLMQSSSGGMATAMYEQMLEKNGCICGVAYNKKYNDVCYCISEQYEMLQKFKGSKYIQAEKGFIFRRIKEEMDRNNKLVLFIGLPCEVAAVKSYLNGDSEKLITCELICHGVTSNTVLEQMVDRLEKKYRSQIKSFTFRNKGKYHNEGTWKNPKIKAVFENGKTYIESLGYSDVGNAFNGMARYSCYNCAFKGDNRVADISIGDFWGLDETSDKYNSNGVSIVIANTQKGLKFVQEIKGISIK